MREKSVGDKWRAWPVTTAYYDAQDPLSFLFSVLSLCPIVVLIFIAGVTETSQVQQQRAAMTLLVGFMWNALLNTLLKFLIGSPRPNHHSPLHSSHRSPNSHGMPSNHAQFMFFFITWLIIKSSMGKGQMSFGVRAFIISMALIVTYGRVYNEFHTYAQVVVGALVGMANAYLCTSTVFELVLHRMALAIMPLRDFCTAWASFI